MWKKTVSAVLCFLLLSSSLFAQQQWSPILSVEQIDQLTYELEANLNEQQRLIGILQTSNEELSMESQIARAELEEVLRRLKESEESLRKQIALTQNLGNLIDDQAIYLRSLERKLNFWRITSAVLATSLATSLIIWGLSK